MSFQGKIQARCPKGCEPFEVSLWTFVRGDQDENLRDSALAGDLNLVQCGDCGQIFPPENTLVYYDAPAELIAFVFPESYRDDEPRWREKMSRDFKLMKDWLKGEMPLDTEPWICFGLAQLAQLLKADDDLEDEGRVAEFLCKELGLGLRRVKRSFTREKSLPWLLPVRSDAKSKFSKDSALDALRRLLQANDRLEGYGRWLQLLETGDLNPPLR